MIYLENDITNPYYNLAFEEYVFNKDDCNKYFWLWQNDNAIIIGKNQNTHEEINNDFVTRNNIKVVRRITGGGAVYHDLGNINFTYIAEKSNRVNDNIDFKTFTNPLIKALSEYGIKAENSGRNDITINGKKVSGNAQYISGNKILHHGTLLFDSNLDTLQNCLNVSAEKIKQKGVSSVKSRVCNISEYVDVGINQFKNRLIKFMFNENRHMNSDRITEYDYAQINALAKSKYETWDWNYGKSPKYNYKNEKRIENCGTINIYLEHENDLIKSCKIRGDFFHLKSIENLENIIENTQKQILPERLLHINVSDYIKNLSNDEFITLFAI